jgi:hypothetical protein
MPFFDKFLPWSCELYMYIFIYSPSCVIQGRILVEILREMEKKLGEVQRSSSRPPWKVRAYFRTGQSQRCDVCM